MQVNWFRRKFTIGNEQNILPALIERLEGTTIRLHAKITPLTQQQLKFKFDSKWSILEHVGHLGDLEELWSDRLDDITTGQKYLRDADLENTQTHEAGHNHFNFEDRIERFNTKRKNTIGSLRSLDENALFKSSLHPRLESPMNVIDLFSFVADHDDHHLAKMQELLAIITK